MLTRRQCPPLLCAGGCAGGGSDRGGGSPRCEGAPLHPPAHPAERVLLGTRQRVQEAGWERRWRLAAPFLHPAHNTQRLYPFTRCTKFDNPHPWRVQPLPPPALSPSPPLRSPLLPPALMAGTLRQSFPAAAVAGAVLLAIVASGAAAADLPPSAGVVRQYSIEAKTPRNYQAKEPKAPTPALVAGTAAGVDFPQCKKVWRKCGVDSASCKTTKACTQRGCSHQVPYVCTVPVKSTYGCAVNQTVDCAKPVWRSYPCDKWAWGWVADGCERAVAKAYGCRKEVPAICTKGRDVTVACDVTKTVACKKWVPQQCSKRVHKQCHNIESKSAPCTKTFQKEVNCASGRRYGYDG